MSNPEFKAKALEKLAKAAKTLTERQFMLLVEYDTSWTIEEKLKFYRTHCKKD